MRWVVALSLVAGCSFETRVSVNDATQPDMPPDPDVDTDMDGFLDRDDNCPRTANPLQRDWDGDKHGDECDRCPHLPSAADPDMDNDGVGDACDPRPTQPGDQRIHWLAFYDASEIATWTSATKPSWVVANGKLSETTNGLTFLDSPQTHGDIYFATRIEIENPASYEIGFCGGEVGMGQQYYCCAVTNNPGRSARAVSGWVGQSQISMPVAFPGVLDQGSVVDVVGAMSATAMNCTFTQGTSVNVTSSTMRGPQVPGTATFYTQTKAHYRYVFVVGVNGS